MPMDKSPCDSQTDLLYIQAVKNLDVILPGMTFVKDFH